LVMAQQQQAPDVPNLTASQDLADKLDSFVIVDVRRQDERQNIGFLPNSKHIEVTELLSEQKQLDAPKDAAVLVYCFGGIRGAKATDYLLSHGWTKAVNLNGGLKEWIAAGLPVDKYPQ